MSYILRKAIHSRLQRLTSILIASLFSAIYCLPASAADELLINEVELNPAGTDIGEEKVELHNPSNSTIDVSGWTITSTGGAPVTVVINEGTTISPKGYFVVGRDLQQQWLDNAGEVIELRNNSGILIDSVGPFSDGANDDESWQRSPNGQDNWVFSRSTLGGINNSAASVSEPGSPKPLAPENPIKSGPPPAANPSFEGISQIQPSQNLTITFIDVGQGDSILVTLPDTKTLLI